MSVITIGQSGSLKVAHVKGELNTATVEEFTESLYDHVAGPDAVIALELSKLESIDSSGLSALVSLTTRARLSGGRVLLVAPTPFVEGILCATRLDSWFEIFSSLDDAIARMGA